MKYYSWLHKYILLDNYIIFIVNTILDFFFYNIITKNQTNKIT